MNLRNNKNRIQTATAAFLLILSMICTVPALAQDQDMGLARDLRNQTEELQRRYIRLLSDAETRVSEETTQVKNKLQDLQSRLNSVLGGNSTLPIGEDQIDTVMPDLSGVINGTAAKVTDKIKGFLDNMKKRGNDAVDTVKGKSRQGIITVVHGLIKRERYELAVVTCRSALEKSREAGDEEAVDEFGATLVYALYKSGKIDEAREALAQHQDDRLPAIEKKIEKNLAGTEFDPEYKTLLTEAKSVRQGEKDKEKTYGKKPGFFTHFNPFYQVARIKNHFSAKDFQKKATTTLNRAYARVAAAQEKVRMAPSNRTYTNELDNAMRQYNALSSMATDFADNPDTVIADTDVQLFDPSNLFATSGTTLYNSPDEVFQTFKPSDAASNDVCTAKAHLITVNPEAWHARWFMLSSAKRSIDTTYFILDPDPFGKAFLGMLLKKAQEGVKIRLMVDASGVKGYSRSFMGQDYLQEIMMYDNVQIRTFNPYAKNLYRVFTSGIRAFMASNHDKIIVVDGEYAITGGRNIAEHYFAHPDDNSGVYRDTCVLMQGKAVAAQLTTAFAEEFDRNRNYGVDEDSFGNWKKRDKEMLMAYRLMDDFLRGKEYHKIVEEFPDCAKEAEEIIEELEKLPKNVGYDEFVPFLDDRKIAIKIVDKHSINEERNDITLNVINCMDACKKEIIIQNPYVVLTKRARAAIVRASRRGVKIVILSNSPMSTDSALTQAMFLQDWKEVLRDAPNLEIWAMKGPNKLHAKVFVFDRQVSVIGTYNMDPMSEQINSEVAAMISDEQFSKDCAERIYKDMENSFRYTIEIDSNGNVKEKFGPESHSDEGVIKKLKLLGIAKLIRPLI
ncbi:MAG: hypothetical protein CVV64_10935 [Candidatus Wallbacteria bacterium HGW-Wallbacteria-1]|jgi:phosphatidylserine/phosphatidylglycerophosphate/cardiolipin synthase-like enzyme|uniref:PLD phosphodiesterase domain-containing protein n=1 Tax=Candidatus Wallbacteria bacterium HGW-Wallbacteria-1 TaxID=2013854 RepID=A0A2N1PPG6_9BACT|nr:MAG: hypothetical protein CVV64_10935 [Candidatus Wallbacteria bacterium HGW-Wallbacteria-1]